MNFKRIDRHHSVAYLSEENYSYDNFKDMEVIVGIKGRKDKSFPNNKVSTAIYMDNDYVYIETSLVRLKGGPNKSLVTRLDKKTMESAREEFQIKKFLAQCYY
tara:strand:+ start:477 stop:785 length:309 start_codon:yes stop_codon:yes gene_type:complete